MTKRSMKYMTYVCGQIQNMNKCMNMNEALAFNELGLCVCFSWYLFVYLVLWFMVFMLIVQHFGLHGQF